MQIHAVQGNWGGAPLEDINKLLRDTASHLERLLRNPIYGIILVKPGPTSEDPITLYRSSPREPYIIKLSTRGTKWNQYAYQFSHEFCHVLSGYDHLKENPNNWFHETICELASIFILRRMSERWPTDPPYPNWADYSKLLKSYSAKRLSCQEVQLPTGISLHCWLLSHENTLREDKYQRDKNALVAYQLLPIFEDTPAGWNAIRRLPNSTKPLADYFVDWHSSVDLADKPFIVRLSNAFGYPVC